MGSSNPLKGWAQSFSKININDQDEPVAAVNAIKTGIVSWYDAATDWSMKGELWNWGLHDQEVAEEIEKLIPGFSQFGTDTYSEQLYLLTLRELPLSYESYATKNVLEVGCGMGEGLNFLSRVISARRMVGLDLSQKAIERANSMLSRPDKLRFVHGDAEQLPFEDSEFDVVINVESSHSYPDPGRFIKEAARVLKPGGYFSHVDIFTDQRLAEFHRIQTENVSFDWLQERDISENVRAAIRRRVVPGSFARKVYLEKKKRIPFAIRRAGGPGGIRGFGAAFIGDPGPILHRISNIAHRRPTRSPMMDATYRLTTACKLPS